MLSHWSIFMIGLTVFCFTFQYLLAPILVRSKNTQPLKRSFTELPVDFALFHLPPTFPQKIYELEQMGFSMVGHLAMNADETIVTGIISLLVNRGTRTMATVATLFVKSGKPASAHFVEFITEFADGSQINTINSPTVSVFRRVPQKVIYRIPHLWSAVPLHHVHRYLVEQESGRSAVLPAEGAELSHLRELFDMTLSQQVDLGYFFLDETAQRYRMTWATAFETCWRLLWPAKHIIQYSQNRTGRRLAQDAGIRS